MIEKYILPFDDSLITSYSNIAFNYSILKANFSNNDFEKILCNKYIKLVFDGELVGNRFSFSFGDDWYSLNNILSYQQVDLQKRTYDILKIDIVAYLRKILFANNYVQVKCDKSFIDGGDFDHRIDYCLVSGYNDISNTFKVSYLDINNVLKTKDVDYNVFVKALFSLPLDSIKFYFIKVNSDAIVTLDLKSSITELNAYINSQSLKPLVERNKYYGINALEQLALYFDNKMKVGCPICEAYLNCLKEHKCLMYKRVSFLSDCFNLPAMFSLRAYKASDNVNEIFKIGNLYNKYHSKEAVQQMIELMNQTIDIEKDYISQLIHILNLI